jgi:hypothetical protein
MREWWIGNELQWSCDDFSAKRQHISVGHHPDGLGLRCGGAVSVFWKLHSFDIFRSLVA